jgi:SAM-dependent methyltransferase
MKVGFRDYVGLGRPQWRGERSPAKALWFLLLGSPDTHARIRNTHVLELIGGLEFGDHARVLELGSARGLSLFWLARRHPKWQLVGVDLEEEWVTISQRAARRGGYGNLSFQHGAAEELAEEAAYDLIICIDALEHITDDLGLLVKMKTALKNDGYLVLHVPRRRQDQWRLLKAFRRHEVDGHIGEEYRESELRLLLDRAGYHLHDFRQTFGTWGEISFELNMLFWKRRRLRNVLALLTYPLAVPLGYIDVRYRPARGNGFLIAAQRRDEQEMQ